MKYPEGSRLAVISIKFGVDFGTRRNAIEIEYGIHSRVKLESGAHQNRYHTTGVLTFPLEKLLEYGIDFESEAEVKTIAEIENILYRVKKLASRLVASNQKMEFQVDEEIWDDEDAFHPEMIEDQDESEGNAQS